MASYVLDTNIWIRILRRNKKAGDEMEAALARGDQIFLTSIVYFELLRGLRKREDFESIGFIENLQNAHGVVYQECSRAVWDAAIELWVDRTLTNRQKEDADTIIAAFAKHLNATVVTDNVKHFSDLKVPIANWG